ncbi:MAG: hypothetical protein WCE79_20175 [Xanthobacteraceae bacterium]
MREWVLSLIAFALAAYVVALWAYFSFHSPHRIDEIRYAVRRPRYLLAVTAYVGAMMHLHVLMIILYCMLASRVMNLADPSALGVNDPDAFAKIAPPALAAAAMLAALSVTLLFPALPYARRAIDLLRQAAHEFALYPFAREAVTSILERSEFEIEKDATPALLKELGCYGVASEAKALLLPSAWGYLEEVYTLVMRLQELGRKPDLAAFSEARREQFERLDWGFARLIRRTARALQYGQSIDRLPAPEAQYSEKRKKLAAALSTFVTEESDGLLRRCHKLLSEAALSTESDASKREQLLARVGYRKVVLPKQLPTAALLIIGAVFPLELLIFVTAYQFGLFPQGRWDLKQVVALGLVRAICQTAAIGWAIFPKVIVSWARPSIDERPRKSYAIFGFASFAFSVLAFVLLWQTFPRPSGAGAIVPLAVVNAFFFLVMTLALSLCIDRRLQAPAYDYDGGRWSDAAILGGSIGVTMVVALDVVPLITGSSARDPVAMLVFTVVLVLEAALIGYFVPATAAAHLEARLVQALDGAKAEGQSLEDQRPSENQEQPGAPAQGVPLPLGYTAAVRQNTTVTSA